MTCWKKTVVWVVAATSMLLLIAGEAASDALDDRTELKNEVIHLFSGSKFAELEAMNARFRKTKERSASGRWQLTVFDNGLAWAFTDHRKKYGDGTFWDKTEGKVKRWIEAYPESPTAHLAYARFLLSRGWNLDDEKPEAVQRKPKDLERFLKYAEQARRYLESTKAIAASDPNWYRLMVEIARWQQWPEPAFRALTNEAFDKEPLFYRTYLAAALYYFREDGDNADALEMFAQDALRRTEAREGATLYTRIYWHVSDRAVGERLFLDTNVDWDTMEQGIDDIMDAYPDNWNAHNFAKFACLAGDVQMTADMFTHISGSQSKMKFMMAWGRPSLFSECFRQVVAKPRAIKEYARDVVRFLMQ